MKKFTLVAVMAIALGWSCSERDAEPAPDPITSVVEVSLNSPSGAANKAFGETSATETWEKAADNIAMFVYKTGETTCAYQRQFTAKELEKCKAVFAIPNVLPEIDYDFYAVANCDFTAEMRTYDPAQPGTTGIDRTTLLAKVEGTTTPTANPYGDLSSYNGPFDDVSTKALRDVNNTATPHNKGFVMTGLKTEKTPKADANKPTRVTIDLRRTVAKVAIVAATTQNFHDKYGMDGSTLRILSAKLTKLAEKTTIIAPASYTLGALGTATNLTQDPNVVPAGGSGTFAQYQNLFYIFENGGTAAVDPTVKPVLELTALFDFDGDETTSDDQTTITYKVALAGDAGSPDMTSLPLPADFGLFKRNGYYKVVININGLTENEVVASINILDWETLKTQNVNIGDNN